nr:FGGY family carbohydrate kinase [Bauldia sp.]
MGQPGDGPPYLVGIDVGTSSVRAIAFDRRGRKVAAAARPTPVRAVPTGGEHDPEAMFAATLEALGELGRALAGAPVAGIAVASIGESCVLVGADGRSLAPSITWHDRRTHPTARDLAAAIDPHRVFRITGVSIEPIFSLLKLAWMRDHWPAEMAAARRILFMADWIAFRLSGEAATDPSLASRTLAFDIHRRDWSEEMLAFASLDRRLLAPIRPSGFALGPVRPDVLAATGLGGRPVVGVGAHDHIVGSFAAGLVEPGVVLNSLGTAEAVLLSTGAPLADPALSDRGYFQGAVGADRPMTYVGGSIYSSGGTIDWFRAAAGAADKGEIIAAATRPPAGGGGIAVPPPPP